MPAAVNSALPLLTWSWNGKPYKYTVSPNDREWFIRCLWREGKPAETVGHVLLQRFALLASTGSKYPTMTSFLRAYCQPVNPLWFPGGSKSEAFIKRANNRGDSTAANQERERAKRRVIYASTPISKIKPEFVQLADNILYGSSRSPAPRATHFTMSFAGAGDTEATARKKAEAFAKRRGLIHVPIREGHKLGVNWFFVGKQLPPVIRFGTTTAKTLTGFMLFSWGLLGLFLLGRRRS